jgi:hypothetical protein
MDSLDSVKKTKSAFSLSPSPKYVLATKLSLDENLNRRYENAASVVESGSEAFAAGWYKGRCFIYTKFTLVEECTSQKGKQLILVHMDDIAAAASIKEYEVEE